MECICQGISVKNVEPFGKGINHEGSVLIHQTHVLIKTLWDLGDGSAGKDTCCQAANVSLIPRSHVIQGENQLT